MLKIIYKKFHKFSVVLLAILLVLTVVLLFRLCVNGADEDLEVETSTVFVGGSTTVTLTASSDDYVSWSTSHAGIVLLSNECENNGVFSVTVTGMELGYTNITATITHSDYTTTTQTVEVIYVVLQDGIYTIQNLHAKRYITGEFFLRNQIVPDTLTSEIQYSSNTFGDMTNNIYRYWIIDHIENGEYAIYSLANEKCALSFSGTSATFVDINSSIPDNARWYIRGNNIISKANTSLGLIMSLSGVNEENYSGSLYYEYYDVLVRSLDSMLFEEWEFIKHTDLYGVYFRNELTGEITTTFNAIVDYYEGSVSIEDLGYSCIVFNSTDRAGSEYWESSNSKIATVNSSTGVLSLLGGGQVEITKSLAIPDMEIFLSISYNIIVSNDFGIQNNSDYYIMNFGSERYLSLETITDANSTNVSTRANNNISASCWKIEKQNGLEYQLINKYSASSRVLNVSYTNVNIFADSNLSNQKFNIERIDSGEYEGGYYIKYGEYYLSESSDYNVCITSIPSDNSVWSFTKASKGNSVMYDFLYLYTENGVEKDYNTTGKETVFENSFYFAGFAPYVYTNSTPTAAKASMMNSDIFVFRGHGEGGLMYFFSATSNNVPIGVIAENPRNTLMVPFYTSSPDKQYLEGLSNNSLSSVRSALLLGCKTGTVGVGGGNLVDTIYQKGAHFVLGTQQYMTLASDDLFLELFSQYVVDDYSIEEILEKIDDGTNEFKYYSD